ncbi:SWIM zinc finger domain-containing protein [Enterovibrio sp. ZSDZ42]|uniref:SWIM zinc finger domain-containing protein n=1 Tax=Enterovibrio gelatinilyticus TaxID=2899819 RepID=A0ABT5R359_9GAMM|nr:SWIM zinc finger family protein [Enterovibrio sp. ZSDZ42]MDD1794459.1 SWIM zinc finger domain-containing protein [Enterovibrio sp. ZSDZ42]
MEVTYRYANASRVGSNSQQTDMSFSPDLSRPPTFFVGELKDKRRFREAMSSLHDVVISDMRFKPKNREEYQRWLAGEEERLLAEFVSQSGKVKAELDAVSSELADMNRQAGEVLAPYYKAQNTYFDYLYKNDMDAWYVLDPVITIHPDQVFFECFSEDESSYGKLSCQYDVFANVSEQAYGTTNIDYSTKLYNEFQKIRDYRTTLLKIAPDGFNIQTSGGAEYDEKKIDLPESWVRGFLQVSSAMTLPMTTLRLQPMDIHNLCLQLKRKKERVGPRSMRFELNPGQPVQVVMEPWGDVIRFDRSIYQGNTARTVRVWGRRRLLILERLLPIADHFDVHLMGDGLPSFYVANMGPLTFTLGLSGWSANDWSQAGNFDLLAPRETVDQLTSQRVYQALEKTHQESAQSLATRLQLDISTVKSALAQYSQLGLVLYDMTNDVYRLRALYNAPVDLDEIRFNNEREKKAANFVAAKLVTIDKAESDQQGQQLVGTVMDNAHEYHVALSIDNDQRLVKGECQCHFWHQNKLRQGPCEHMLALRLTVSEERLS